MRRRIHQQLPITPAPIDHDHAREFRKISSILDEHPNLDRVFFSASRWRARCSEEPWLILGSSSWVSIEAKPPRGL